MGSYLHLSQLHGRLWITSSVVISVAFFYIGLVWWRKQPVTMLASALVSIAMLLMASNSVIGAWLQMQQSTPIGLHLIYGIIVFTPVVGARMLMRWTEKTFHAQYLCIALGLTLVLLHRLAVTAPH